MRYDVEREGILTPRVGYTYFSQFVGHDLTRDVTPLNGTCPGDQLTPNFRTPYLNLEQLYGGGPKVSPHLYEGKAEAEVFKIGKSLEHRYPRDLLIQNGQVLVADDRNLDNLIVRQLHLVFLKFHNEAVAQLSPNRLRVSDSDALGPGTIFERAQRLVTWHYQWIVQYDLLPRILHNNIWDRQRVTATSLFQSNEPFSIPFEFSLAAFRFGHSMVRNAYALNCRRKRVALPELMAVGHTSSPLPDDLLVEWGRFFDGLPVSGPVASSLFIDTSIVAPLHDLAPSTIRLCSNADSVPESARLPVRTLLRGGRHRLASGQEVARTLVDHGMIRARDCLTTTELGQDLCNHSGSVLREMRLEHNTPLFYYLLKEAEIKGFGRTLGPIGSYIVNYTIDRALDRDSNPYLSRQSRRRAKLPVWQFPNGSQRTVHSLREIIRLVGDEKLLPDCDTKARNLQPSN
jgi:hypothetical protein